MVRGLEAPTVTMLAVGGILRNMYGLITAFENVRQENDGRRPSRQASKVKQNRVRCDLLLELDVASGRSRKRTTRSRRG